MKLINKFKKVIMVLLDEHYLDKTDENKYYRSVFLHLISKEDNPVGKIKNLETTINRLSDKITILNDKITEMEKTVTTATTTQEELLNMFDHVVCGNNYDEEEYELYEAPDKKFDIN